MARALTTSEVILGIASLVPPIGLMLMYFGGGALFQLVGYGVLAIPIVGVVATYWALFHVYRNKHLGARGLAWVLALVLLWFLLLPAFWYQKIYLPSAKAT